MPVIRNTLRSMLAAGVAGATIAACTPQESLYNGTERAARNEVQLVRLAHHVPAAPAELAEKDQKAIADFFGEVGVGYGDTVSLVRAADFSAEATGSIADLLRNYGLRLMTPPAGVALPEDPAGAILLVDRFVVTPPDCPSTTLQLSRNFANAQMPHIGCANTINLGQMVANPRDLVAGTGDQRPITDKATQAIRLWRADEPEFLEPQNIDEGATSFGESGGGGGF